MRFDDILKYFAENEIYENNSNDAKKLRYFLTNPSTGFLKPVDSLGSVKVYNNNEIEEIVEAFKNYKKDINNYATIWKLIKKDYKALTAPNNDKIKHLSSKSDRIFNNHLEQLVIVNESLQEKNQKLNDEIYALKDKINQLESHINNIEKISDLVVDKVVKKIKDNEW